MIEPIVAKVTLFRCPFCRFKRQRRAATTRHIEHCFHNPDRVPWLGELTSVKFTGKLKDFGADFSLPNNMNWLEWVEHTTMPKWWPGPGKIWDGSAWSDVPGWRVECPEGAHGCAGGAPPNDVWPEIGGTSLREIPAAFRIGALFPQRRMLS